MTRATTVDDMRLRIAPASSTRATLGAHHAPVTLNDLARILRAAAAECDRLASEQAPAPVAATSDLLPLADCGVPVRTLRGAIRRGELRASKVGRSYFVQRDDLAAYVEARRVSPAPPQPRKLTAAQRAIQAAQRAGTLRVVGGAR